MGCGTASAHSVGSVSGCSQDPARLTSRPVGRAAGRRASCLRRCRTLSACVTGLWRACTASGKGWDALTPARSSSSGRSPLWFHSSCVASVTADSASFHPAASPPSTLTPRHCRSFVITTPPGTCPSRVRLSAPLGGCCPPGFCSHLEVLLPSCVHCLSTSAGRGQGPGAAAL